MDFHAATVPIFARMLRSMVAWLDKAARHAEARGFSPDNYLQLRLAPDMLPLVKQVQIASDTAKGCMSRLAGEAVPSWPDDEANFAQLRARVVRTLEHVLSFEPARLQDAAGRQITIPRRQGDPLQFAAPDYVAHFATPNFYFHATMLYALLREAGVELGKADYLGGGS